MKLKKLTLTESNKLYELDEATELYISVDDNAETLTLDEVTNLLGEGEISFTKDDVILDEAKDDEEDDSEDEDDLEEGKKSDEEDEDESKSEEDKEDAKDEKEEKLKESLDSIFDFKVELSEEDKKALFEGQEETLSEEAQDKTVLVFEAAVREKAKEIAIEAADAYSEYAKSITEAKEASLQNDVNDYLDYVVTEWVKENEIAIESSLKVEMNDSFMDGLQNLFKEHYIEVPDGRYDILEGLADKVQSLESELEAEIGKNVKLTSEAKSISKDQVIKNLSEDLTNSQKEKFANLLENIKDADLEEFETKASALKESFFKSAAHAEDDADTLITEDNLNEDGKDDESQLTGIDALIAKAKNI